MLSSVIIVLRETLEASLLVGLLFVYSYYFSIDKKWLLSSLLFGLFFSLTVAIQLPEISDLFDGIGQELLFFSVLAMLSILIQWSGWQVIASNTIKINSNRLKFIYSAIILLAVSLEGAEIIIYFQSRIMSGSSLYASSLGSLLGLGIGVSIGSLAYYLFSQMSRTGLLFCFSLLTLISAGMASQAYSYLMQADIVDSGYPIWNSNSLIEEVSLTGQLLYALVGYEATPTLAQVFIYISYISFPLCTIYYLRHSKTSKKTS